MLLDHGCVCLRVKKGGPKVRGHGGCEMKELKTEILGLL